MHIQAKLRKMIERKAYYELKDCVEDKDVRSWREIKYMKELYNMLNVDISFKAFGSKQVVPICYVLCKLLQTKHYNLQK